MEQTLSLLERLQALEDDAAGLAEAMAAAADALRAKHRLPPPSLPGALQRLRDEVEALARAVEEGGVRSEAPTLPALRAALEAHERQAALREEVRAVYARVLRLETTEEQAAEGLTRARVQAWAYDRQGADAATLHALAEGRHPLCALLALLDRQGLTFRELSKLERRVEKAYGRDLCRAVAYGLLRERGAAGGASEEEARSAEPPPPAGPPARPAPEAVSGAAQGDGRPGTLDGGAEALAVTPAAEPSAPPAADPTAEVAVDAEVGDDPVEAVEAEPEVGGAAAVETEGEAAPEREAAAVREASEPEPEVAVAEEPEVATAEEPELEDAEEAVAEEPEPEEAVTGEEGAAVLARRMLRGGGVVHPLLLWALVAERRPAVAYQLAAAAQRAGRLEAAPGVVALGPPFLRALVLGPHLCSNVGDYARLLQDDYAGVTEHQAEGAPAMQHATQLLAFASTLVPSLFAPHTNAPFVLDRLALHELPVVQRVARAVSGYAKKGRPVRVVAEEQVWKDALHTLRDEVTGWLGRAESKTVNYQGATRIWRHWVRPGGFLYELLHPLARGTARVADVREQLHELDRDAIADLIDDAVGQVLSNNQQVEARARETLIRWAQDGRALAERWLALRQAAPDEGDDWVAEQSQQLLETLEACWHEAAAELEEEVAAAGPDACLRTGAAMAREALEAARRRLRDDEGGRHETPPRYLLHPPLLHLPACKLRDDWSVAEEALEDASALVDQLLRHVADEAAGWGQAFHVQCEAGDHEATDRIVQLAEACPEVVGLDAEVLRRRRQDELAACWRQYENELNDVLGEVEEAAALQLITPDEWETHRHELASLREALHQVERFVEVDAHVQRARTLIERRRREQAAARRPRMETQQFKDQLARLDEREAPVGDTSYADYVRARIDEALQRTDLPLADGYIQNVLDGHPLPPDGTGTTAFDDFFPDFCAGLEDHFRRASDARVFKHYRQEAERRRIHGGVDLLRTWEAVRRRSGNVSQKQFEVLLEELGLAGARFDIEHSRGQHYAQVDTEVLADRNVCPVPAFGSAAQGRYRVVFVWGDLTVDDLVTQVGSLQVSRRAMVVFYFGALDPEQRRELARRAAEGRQAFLVLDDHLLLYLSMRKRPRLRAFFESALPFAYDEPYTDRSGQVPPEMFFGRGTERTQLLDMDGASLVYGGRQLGKTALLYDVQRQFRAQSPHHVAEYVDLRGLGLQQRQPDAVWKLLVRRLKKSEVLGTDVRADASYDRLHAQLLAWLDEEEERRLLVLFDESDDFVSADEQGGFTQCNRFVALMNESGRRVKFVFAGLHNVLRFTNRSNHPLAHLGKPIQVGPLIREQGRDGRALIEKPFAALGYRFDPPHLASLIQFHTNSYPSLLQLYGRELLADLNRHRQHHSAGPPFRITRAEVDKAYRSNELREAIRDKFALTLQLDPRYALLTYLVAYHTLDDGAEGFRVGYEVEMLREEALAYWEDGFRGNARSEDFTALLDELVGLGVLQTVTGDRAAARYALRSPNLLHLLGTKDELGLKIARFEDEDYPPAYNRSTYRAVVPGRHGDFRAPLTAEQALPLIEPHDHETVLLMGTPASGLDAAPAFLQQQGAPLRVVAEPLASPAALEERLDRAWREADGAMVVLVQAQAGWRLPHLEAGLGWVRRRRTRGASVVFEAGPEQVWHVVEQDGAVADLRDRGMRLVSLQPWHADAVHHWLSDGGCGKADVREKVSTLTGNWPFLLERLQGADAVSLARAVEAFQGPEGDAELACAFLDALGVPREGRRRRVLDKLAVADAEGMAAEHLAQATGVDVGFVETTLRWADRLALARPSRHGRWKADAALSLSLLMASIASDP